MLKWQYFIPFNYLTSKCCILLLHISVKWSLHCSVYLLYKILCSSSCRVKSAYVFVFFWWLNILTNNVSYMKAYLPVYCFSHLRLNRFNFLTVQGIYAGRLPRWFLFLQTHKILHSIAPLEKMQLKMFQINVQAFDKYVHSMEGMA